MAVTRTEEKLRLLNYLWLLLFGGGFIVLAVTFWLPVGAGLHLDNPLVAFTWIGQALLFLCCFSLLSGIRDNDLNAGVVGCYKLLSGTMTMLFLLGYAHTTFYTLFVIVVGGLFDYVMGILTFGLWLAARRSRALRMPLALDVEPGIDEEPDSAAARAQRVALIATGVLFTITMLAIIVVGFSSFVSHSVTFYEVTAGNTVALYGTLAILCMLAAEAPQRRFYTLDTLLCVSLLIGIVLLGWVLRFGLSTPYSVVFLIMGPAHIVIAAINFLLRRQAAYKERPTRFLGPWLHRCLENFAEVIISGGIEDMTLREVADAADTLLADIPSQRKMGIKRALVSIELASLLRFRVPMSRMGRLERTLYLTHTFVRGELFFHDLVKIKELVFFVYYSDKRSQETVGLSSTREQGNEVRQAHESAGAASVQSSSSPARHLHVDVCVIGSGAGGSVVAAKLAEAGKSVIVLEEGPLLAHNRSSYDERALMVRAYRDGGLQLRNDLEVSLQQGRCVGGGTFLGDGICVEPPAAVLTSWAELGAKLDKDRLQTSFTHVRDTIHPVKLFDYPQLLEEGSLKFAEGCRKLGLASEWFEASLGDDPGRGQDGAEHTAYIQRALKVGATLISECKALKVETSGAKAHTVTARYKDGTPLSIEAQQIVIACGGIESSALLLRSGITRNVGTCLSLNVRSLVFAEFAQPIDAFRGLQMSAYLNRPRYTLESLAMPPAAFAAAIPGWFNDHFDNMHAYPHFAISGVLVGTQPVGRVSLIDDTGSTVRFDLPLTDLRKVKDGVKQLCRIELAAGAQRVLPATFTPSVFYDTTQLDSLDELIVETDDVALSSTHVQGGNPMNDDANIGAVDTQFRVHGFDNLYVCDASVFPTSLQVEPQLTIMALADYAAQGMLATTGVEPTVPVAVHRSRSLRPDTNVEPSVEA